MIINYAIGWDEHWKMTAAAKSLQSCLTLSDSTDGSPPAFPIPGILQARTLEWVAILCKKQAVPSGLLRAHVFPA